MRVCCDPQSGVWFGFAENQWSAVPRTVRSGVYHLDRTQDGYPVGVANWWSLSQCPCALCTGKMQPLPPLDTRAELGGTEALQIAQAAIADWSGTLAGYSAEKGILYQLGRRILLIA